MAKTYSSPEEISTAMHFFLLPVGHAPGFSTSEKDIISTLKLSRTVLGRMALRKDVHYVDPGGVNTRRYHMEHVAVYAYRMLKRVDCPNMKTYVARVSEQCRVKMQERRTQRHQHQSDDKADRILSILRDATVDKPKARAFIVATLAEHGIDM